MLPLLPIIIIIIKHNTTKKLLYNQFTGVSLIDFLLYLDEIPLSIYQFDDFCILLNFATYVYSILYRSIKRKKKVNLNKNSEIFIFQFRLG